MLLHLYVLTHIVEIFEVQQRRRQPDARRRLVTRVCLNWACSTDGVYFAEKDSESSTVYTSLANYRYSKTRDKTQVQYMGGAFGSLPILSEFNFTANAKEE